MCRIVRGSFTLTNAVSRTVKGFSPTLEAETLVDDTLLSRRDADLRGSEYYNSGKLQNYDARWFSCMYNSFDVRPFGYEPRFNKWMLRPVVNALRGAQGSKVGPRTGCAAPAPSGQ